MADESVLNDDKTQCVEMYLHSITKFTEDYDSKLNADTKKRGKDSAGSYITDKK